MPMFLLLINLTVASTKEAYSCITYAKQPTNLSFFLSTPTINFES